MEREKRIKDNVLIYALVLFFCYDGLILTAILKYGKLMQTENFYKYIVALWLL